MSMSRSRVPRKRSKTAALVLLLFAGAWLVWTGMSYAVSTRMYFIPSGSMSPTLRPGDRVGVNIGGSALPKRGEVWLFRMPEASGMAPAEAIKRVIGLPGETVEIANGSVLIDGRILAEPYLSAPPSYTMAPLTLSSDQYFMLGDSRNASHDSHVWGPLTRERLVGLVQMRCWPMSRLGGL